MSTKFYKHSSAARWKLYKNNIIILIYRLGIISVTLHCNILILLYIYIYILFCCTSWSFSNTFYNNICAWVIQCDDTFFLRSYWLILSIHATMRRNDIIILRNYYINTLWIAKQPHSTILILNGAMNVFFL